MTSLKTNSLLSFACAAFFFINVSFNGFIVSNATSSAKSQVFIEANLATHIVESSGISRGVCSILGAGDGKLALGITRASGFFIHVVEPENTAVTKIQEMIDAQNLYGKRVIVEKKSLKQLPYADNTIDLIIAADLTQEKLNELSLSEIHRVLRPGGKAIFGNQKDFQSNLNSEQLKNLIQTAHVFGIKVTEDEFGLWAVVTKPALAGVDAWSHWEHGPDNNPVSTDKVIKAPYITQWYGGPLYIGMPAVTTAAGGRTFIAMGHIAHHEREEPWLNTLYARNGYNGTELWIRKLPDGYLAHRSAFIATENTFYMIDTDGNGCLLLDPETGEEKDRIHISEINGEWKWIAIENGTLFALIGETKDPTETTLIRSERTHWSWGELSKGYYTKRVPWGFGTTILAYDLDRKKVVWTHKEEAPVDSRAMVIGDEKIFFYGPDSRLGCLNTITGNLIWANNDPKVRELIEEPGRGLKSTPGFKTTCYCLYTPKALFYEAQTNMNIVAVSNKDGSLLWSRSKTTSNPNMMYVDEQLLVGIGPEGNILVVDPLSGTTIKDLGFKKRSCARLVATEDSYFCRGWPEGLTRYDRKTGKILFNGAIRPSCQDGVIPANGMLYIGPWLCDCNLSLMGAVGLCSAGDFKFDYEATESERLETGETSISNLTPLEVSPVDWPTYRSNNSRNAASQAMVPKEVSKIWEFKQQYESKPTAPTAAGGLIFIGGEDCKVRAIDAATGTMKWCFLTAGPILQSPTIWNGRAYVGSGDGYIYCLDAAAGNLLWRFRAAPIERRIMMYGSLCSTWPVNTGVVVENGVAYAGAGIIDYDGTYVYALDALTGEIKWQNNSSGHLDNELRKGISAQGILTIADGKLWMPGGNVISPAVYELATGRYLGGSPGDGSPKANRGEEIGVFNNRYIVFGGRLQYSATENVVDPGTFDALPISSKAGTPMTLTSGKITPAWDENKVVSVSGRYSMPSCYLFNKIDEYLTKGDRKAPRPEPLWSANNPNKSGAVSLAIAENAIITVYETPGYVYGQLNPRWTVCALNPQDGTVIWQQNLASPALPGGLLIDKDGRVVVVMQNGSVACFGEKKV